MRRLGRRWSWGALFAVLLLVAAACGDSSGDTTAATDPPGTEAPTTEAPTTEAPTTEAPTTEAPTTEGPTDPVTIGMILVGPENDRGWSQAHAEGGAYVVNQLGGELIIIDKVNPADRPETTIEAVAADMIDQGADIIFATSDDMKDGIEAAAAQFPDTPMIWSSGDSAWSEAPGYRADLTNLGNTMGRMEFGKAMAGCAAAMTTQTGSIGYVGPLINDETRRLVNSAYLGADYCWKEYRGETSDIAFEVNWIGFWFNIPGFTLDPTQVSNDFLDGGADVLISGIDTTEAIVRTGQRAAAGEEVWAIPYDFQGACDEAPEFCLGVPYFNWGPEYLKIVQSVADGTFEATWNWFGPDWENINDAQSSGIGWIDGDALSTEAAQSLAQFISGLGDGSINPWVGPLNYQDGTAWLADGEAATDIQIWFTEQLLEGVDGASS
ncbi:MAG: BMP family ABC transporter substrate-binding protein [Acidimicrobiia bacterium]|nr:BMP family ABC transporter substrate-binding protein [Acidimicrobiia bacterium]